MRGSMRYLKENKKPWSRLSAQNCLDMITVMVMVVMMMMRRRMMRIRRGLGENHDDQYDEL